ncbi:MAG: DsrE family protein [Saprospiraceae bacterium]|nr:DsrE family protein [Saprospiraceae bacterium]MBK8670102.1 DsrE family protein [Saprospiraceae bacterium]
MKPLFMFFLASLFFIGSISGQRKEKPASKKVRMHKIVFQMVSKDTADHNAMVRQLFNIQKLSPNTKLEVVCHGPGINFIQKEKSLVLSKLEELASSNVDFVACEFTMQQKNIKKEQLMDKCRTVPGGILEIVEKQEQGWSYIKAGY